MIFAKFTPISYLFAMRAVAGGVLYDHRLFPQCRGQYPVRSSICRSFYCGFRAPCGCVPVRYAMKTIVFALILASIFQPPSALRVSEAEVYNSDCESSSVTFIDPYGRLWDVLVDDSTDYNTGDKYTLVFDNMDTASVLDDAIVAIATEVSYAKS